MVDVQCSGRTLRLLNVQLEPHDVATRQRQAEEVVTFVRQVATPNCVLMGAFQSVVQATAAPHSAPGVTPDQTMEIITTGLRDRLRIVADPSPTYPAGAPRDRIDHVLIGPGLQAVDTHVVMLDKPVSDHLPVLVRLRWALPLVQHHGSHSDEHL
jgi:endonuclease/exonuclease/phosphatase family metal-dependent hydrolase